MSHLPAAQALLLRGTQLLLQGDARAARAELSRAAKLDPKSAVAHFNQAVAERLLGHLDLALGLATKALALRPTPQAHALVGLLRQLRGDLPRAIGSYQSALALDPGHRVSRYYLGMALRLRGENAAAVEALSLACAPGPSPLPDLVIERVRGQLHDARRAPAQGPAVDGTQCATAAVTEVLLPEDFAVSEADPPADPLAASGATPVEPEEVAQLLHRARRVVALTGAGLSVESGLHSRKSLWSVYDRDRAVSVGRFVGSPASLWLVVRDFLGDGGHEPNPGHVALAHLPRLAGIVTQNVDHLHQRAAREASGPIVELHGTLEATRCHDCGSQGAPARTFVRPGQTLPPRCRLCRRGVLRPDVVLFGEWVSPDRLAAAAALARGCDLLLVVGCSLDVAPASELARLAARQGATVVEVNPAPSRVSDAVGSRMLQGTAATALPAVYAALAAREGLAPLPPAPVRAPRPLSPPNVVPMPRFTDASDRYTVVEWCRAPGDVVREGERLAVVSLDKVDVELFAPYSGVLRTRLAQADDAVDVGAPFAEIDPLP